MTDGQRSRNTQEEKRRWPVGPKITYLRRGLMDGQLCAGSPEDEPYRL